MIYFDNSATTELSSAAKTAMTGAMEVYGNPSSLHSSGLEAEKLLRSARKDILGTLTGSRGVGKSPELVFTSCGSEANNLALLGTATAKSRREATKILLTDSEHPSVENAARRLEALGFGLVRVGTKGGILDLDTVEREANGVFLASFMLVNNETGARYDVEEAFGLIKSRSPEAICHCDAVQGYLKTSFTFGSLGADLLTVSAHKIHGPKGVGALLISPEMITKKKIIPIIFGGGQEGGLRSGTENIIGIAGFAAAAREGYAALDGTLERMSAIRERLIRSLPDGVRANLPKGKHAPHILSITLPRIKSETMLHFLSSKGICVSSGSACSSHSREVSRALTAFGLTPADADTTLRISISEYNTEEEAAVLCAALAEGIERLVKIR